MAKMDHFRQKLNPPTLSASNVSAKVTIAAEVNMPKMRDSPTIRTKSSARCPSTKRRCSRRARTDRLMRPTSSKLNKYPLLPPTSAVDWSHTALLTQILAVAICSSSIIPSWVAGRDLLNPSLMRSPHARFENTAVDTTLASVNKFSSQSPLQPKHPAGRFFTSNI